MKKIISIACILLATSAYAQTGTWSGSLDLQGTKLSLVFHLDGEKPTMDSPDQGARGIPMQYELDNIGKIKISIPSISKTLAGRTTSVSPDLS